MLELVAGDAYALSEVRTLHLALRTASCRSRHSRVATLLLSLCLSLLVFFLFLSLFPSNVRTRSESVLCLRSSFVYFKSEHVASLVTYCAQKQQLRACQRRAPLAAGRPGLTDSEPCASTMRQQRHAPTSFSDRLWLALIICTTTRANTSTNTPRAESPSTRPLLTPNHICRLSDPANQLPTDVSMMLPPHVMGCCFSPFCDFVFYYFRRFVYFFVAGWRSNGCRRVKNK